MTTRASDSQRSGGEVGPAGERHPGPVERLSDPRPGVRRVAVLTLGAATPNREADAALLDRLAVETDARAGALIARALADHGYQPARAALRRLYDDAGTRVEVAHAAILAHDRLEAAGAGP